MTSKIALKSYSFDSMRIETLDESREMDWPVVYQIFNDSELYVGETTNLQNRMRQHIKTESKKHLKRFSVVFDETYNKSVALDLESQLIQWFSGDGKYIMLNRNDGVMNHEYYNREKYKQNFAKIWDLLRKAGLAKNTITKIENSGLFKFSPYKQLNEDQLQIVYSIIMDLESAFMKGEKTISIIGGKEGTGKTIVIMYLVKLLRDIQDFNGPDNLEEEQNMELFFRSPFRERFLEKSIAIVVPNQSLKGSIAKIFKTIDNLSGGKVDILSPIDFGAGAKNYDVAFVDEAHLLKRSNQEVHKANRAKVDEINQQLFGDRAIHTELDWIIKKSQNVIMVYDDQRVRPNNITLQDLSGYGVREHLLKKQMRSRGGTYYIDYLAKILSDSPPRNKQNFDDFEFKLYDNFAKFVGDIRAKNEEFGLSRLVAGFAWDWKSKEDKNEYDIVIDDIGLRWNSTLNDWVGSEQSVEEVGSIYTIQGFDLNYCGVIIGDDLKYDPVRKKLTLDRTKYRDRGAKKRSRQQLEVGAELSDEELLDQVVRTYRILMNRSILGTYVYVCDENLREYLRQFVPTV